MARLSLFRQLTLLLFTTIVIALTSAFGLTKDCEKESSFDIRHPDYDEQRLLCDLFHKNGYNPLIRPVRHINDSLAIEFNLALSQIINVDEVNQMMKTNVWLQVYWHDYQLQWEPVKYGKIQSIQVKPEDVWIPDFVLYNNADGNYDVTYKSNAVLYADSMVNWVPPAIYKSSCLIDVQYFPFDQQVCEMKFGSWTHKGKDLTYTFYKNMDKLDLGDYYVSGSWDIIDCPGRIENILDVVTGEEKTLIIFKFILRRKTLFYTVNLIIPCVLISFVSICVFALPADAGEKITLCISVLLALVVFLLLVCKILPPSLTIPLIAKYLLFTFIMNLVAIFSTVIIINRNYRTPRTHQMPYWVRLVFLKELPKFMFMKRPDHDQRWKGTTSTPSSSFPSTPEIKRVNFSSGRQNELLELTEVHHPQCKLKSSICNHKEVHSTHSSSSSHSHFKHSYSATTSTTPVRQDSSDSSNQFVMTPELYNTIEAIRFIYQHLKAEDEYEMVLEDWKYVARVLDRLLLIIFLLVTMAGTAGILLNAPHILHYVDQGEIIKELNDYIENAKASG